MGSFGQCPKSPIITQDSDGRRLPDAAILPDCAAALLLGISVWTLRRNNPVPPVQITDRMRGRRLVRPFFMSAPLSSDLIARFRRQIASQFMCAGRVQLRFNNEINTARSPDRGLTTTTARYR